MPIQCCFDVVPVSKSQFHEMDHLVMRQAFSIQNELGRFYDECVYRAELTRRCKASGLSVVPEAEVIVSCDSFRKSYYLDALINSGEICELKAVESLSGQHESQLLNYLFLSNLQYGKLINFSSPSVQYRFVTTNLTQKNRAVGKINKELWIPKTASGSCIPEIIQILIDDWGMFLDVDLYRQAICHFLGGEEALLRCVDVVVDGNVIGTQKVYLLDDSTCLHVSSTIRHIDSYQKQLLKMLGHTRLKQIHWINFNRETVYLITLKK